MIKVSTFGPQRPLPAISVISYPATEGLKYEYELNRDEKCKNL
jgi:hypothetical protein